MLKNEKIVWYNERNWTCQSHTPCLSPSSSSKGCITLCKPLIFPECKSSVLNRWDSLVTPRGGSTTPTPFVNTVLFVFVHPHPFLSLGTAPIDGFLFVCCCFLWEAVLPEKSQWAPNLCSHRPRCGWSEFSPSSLCVPHSVHRSTFWLTQPDRFT